MAVEAKPVGKPAALPKIERKFRALCGAEMESTFREIRSHVATCDRCKGAAQK